MDLSNYYGLIIAFLFLCTSGFFSYAEACLLSCDPKKLLRDAENKNKKAIRVLNILENKNVMIANILFCETLSDVFLSSLLTIEKTKHFGDKYVFLSGIIITTVVFVFAGLLPKAFALINPEKSSKKISLVMLFSIKILFPITHIMQKLVYYIFAILRIKTKAEEPSLIRDIRDLVSAHRTHFSSSQTSETNSFNMISGISMIESMKVSQIMVHRKNVAMIDIANKNIEEILKEVIEKQHSRIPIYENDVDNIIGVINVHDILDCIIFKEKKERFTKEDFLKILIKPIFIHENTLLLDQLNYFRENHRHMAIVIDEYAVFLGIITMEDIIEKIVGSIYDEDEEKIENNFNIITQRNGDLLVKGDVLLFDLIHKHRFSFDEDEYYSGTVAGFIIDEIGRIPNENEEIQIDDHFFIIKKITNHTIQWVIIKNINSKSSEVEK
jgi:Mg2+/Co2+ transporter CorB